MISSIIMCQALIWEQLSVYDKIVIRNLKN